MWEMLNYAQCKNPNVQEAHLNTGAEVFKGPECSLTFCHVSLKVFRKDLISAMKLPDSHHIPPEDYYLLADTWRQEWEKGVQVLASPDTIPEPSAR